MLWIITLTTMISLFGSNKPFLWFYVMTDLQHVNAVAWVNWTWKIRVDGHQLHFFRYLELSLPNHFKLIIGLKTSVLRCFKRRLSLFKPIFHHWNTLKIWCNCKNQNKLLIDFSNITPIGSLCYISLKSATNDVLQWFACFN